ncbi:hypothetical protein E2C01_067033 [Portunus trituberculatus]|uniref:Uncharacterized protein n=1 Tax=Portunus trituberculatus TaxID=210409 RepID=A0A5B7HIR3_PORTR|nr:hypothetical protein [Portunus trituberculatus]
MERLLPGLRCEDHASEAQRRCSEGEGMWIAVCGGRGSPVADRQISKRRASKPFRSTVMSFWRDRTSTINPCADGNASTVLGKGRRARGVPVSLAGAGLGRECLELRGHRLPLDARGQVDGRRRIEEAAECHSELM